MSGTHGNIFYPQTRAASTLTTLIDADGKEVKVEVREDAELKTKLQEIIDLLVAAGYFRARIKGLSSFDKVVGGMTWCIETCNFDVDVDLLFQENLTIGQKIALTEKIVSVLPQMKCPHQIEPHQIQGLDFIHIFPVIQWLVKRSVETREEMGNMVRAFSISQFNKHYTIPEEQSHDRYLNGIKTINNVYRPVRRFRRKNAPPEDEESRVQSTLLEYGQRISSLMGSKNIEEETAGEQTQQMSPESQKNEEQRMQALMGSMASMDNQEGRLSAGMVGSIVSLQAQEIASAAKHYAELQSKRFEGGVVHTRAHASAALQRQKAILEEQEQNLVAEKERIQKSLDEETERLETLRHARKKVEIELADMQALENEENQGLLRKLQSLVILNESLKKQEVEFREQCKVELGRLQKMVKDAEQEELPDENSGQIAEQFKEENENFQRLRLALAKKNRSFAMLLRQLDEVPGRAELAQYQRRFLELYNQVGTKHKETKQFYTLYNTLDDTKLYFGKELTLLNSILDNYSEAMSSASSKDQFMKQFEAIVEGVKLNKSKVETLCNEERQRRDKLSQQLLSLVETQRSYVSAVRQLSIECRRNEALLAKLRGP